MNNNEICPICYESLYTKPVHTLECNHTYHTECIIKWFRSENNNDGRCAMCNGLESDPVTYIPWWGREFVKERIKVIRRGALKKNADPKIVKEVKKLRKLEDNYKQSMKSLREFKKRDDVKFIKSESKKLWNKRYTGSTKIHRQKNKIVSMFPMTHMLTNTTNINTASNNDLIII